jgi:hypothetical protein
MAEEEGFEPLTQSELPEFVAEEEGFEPRFAPKTLQSTTYRNHPLKLGCLKLSLRIELYRLVMACVSSKRLKVSQKCHMGRILIPK